jgi:hypothetical protein
MDLLEIVHLYTNNAQVGGNIYVVGHGIFLPLKNKSDSVSGEVLSQRQVGWGGQPSDQ